MNEKDKDDSKVFVDKNAIEELMNAHDKLKEGERQQLVATATQSLADMAIVIATYDSVLKGLGIESSMRSALLLALQNHLLKSGGNKHGST